MAQPSDRVALVTGAARGIGEAISSALAADGYAVARHSRRAGRLPAAAAIPHNLSRSTLSRRAPCAGSA